jgi:hypothetical protein
MSEIVMFESTGLNVGLEALTWAVAGFTVKQMRAPQYTV